MPTARPSIRARIGAVLVNSTVPLSAYRPAMPTPTPISAFSIVIPAATSEPKVTTRTIAAIATPITSDEPAAGSLLSTSPPGATCQPWASAAAPTCSYASRCSSVTLSAPSANWTWISPYWPSGLMAWAVSGSTAPTTPGSVAASWVTSVATAWPCGVPSRPGCGALSAMVPVAPLAAGNCSSSRSFASCDSVPGIVKSLDVGPRRVRAARPRPASTTSQSAATTRRRRIAPRPSR